MSNLTPEVYFAPFSQIIPDFAAFCSKLADPLPVHLRMNTLKAPVRETCFRLEQQNILLMKEDPFNLVYRAENMSQPGHLLEFSLGHLHSQALSSVLAAFALGPEPGEAVLDLCAAPGSKTSLLAQLMQNKGIIVANDRNPDRLIPLRANLKRLGVTNTVITRYPGQNFPRRCFFDRVLVDVPCSAEGIKIVVGLELGKALLKAAVLAAENLLDGCAQIVIDQSGKNPSKERKCLNVSLKKRLLALAGITLHKVHAACLGAHAKHLKLCRLIG